jgi:hypothetical protein
VCISKKTPRISRRKTMMGEKNGDSSALQK